MTRVVDLHYAADNHTFRLPKLRLVFRPSPRGFFRTITAPSAGNIYEMIRGARARRASIHKRPVSQKWRVEFSLPANKLRRTGRKTCRVLIFVHVGTHVDFE